MLKGVNLSVKYLAGNYLAIAAGMDGFIYEHPYRVSSDTRNNQLTVMLAAACRSQSLFRVGRGAFQPPPAVDSAVVRLVPHDQPPFPLEAFGDL